MRIEVAGLPLGPIQNFANAVNDYLDRLRSVPKMIVADAATLPPAERNLGRTVIVRDLGGAPGEATALDGVWYDQNWSPL